MTPTMYRRLLSAGRLLLRHVPGVNIILAGPGTLTTDVQNVEITPANFDLESVPDRDILPTEIDTVTPIPSIIAELRSGGTEIRLPDTARISKWLSIAALCGAVVGTFVVGVLGVAVQSAEFAALLGSMVALLPLEH